MNRAIEVGLRVAAKCELSADGVWAERRNPISGDVVTRAPAATIADAAAEAAGTFGDWAGMGASGVE
jgi:hypothetical protein